MTLEVAQHIGDDIVRTIALQPADGLTRGAIVTDTGDADPRFPVGDVTKGHVFNALGRVARRADLRRLNDHRALADPPATSPAVRPARAARPSHLSRPVSRSSTC